MNTVQQCIEKGFENAYFILNSDNKIELHLDGKDAYQLLSEQAKTNVKRAFIWGRERGAWVSRAKNCGIPYSVSSYGIPFKGDEERKEYTEARAQTLGRAEHKAEQYELWAESREKKAESLQSEFNRLRQDWAYITQPNVNTSGGRSFTNQRNRTIERYNKGFESYEIAKSHTEKAEHYKRTLSESELKNESYLINRVKENEKNLRAFEKFETTYADKLDKIDEQPDNWKVWLKARMNFYETSFEKLAFFSEALKELNIAKKEAGIISADDIQEKVKSNVKGEVKKYLKEKYNIDLLKFSSAFGEGTRKHYYIRTEQELPQEYRSGWASPHAAQIPLVRFLKDIETFNASK